MKQIWNSLILFQNFKNNWKLFQNFLSCSIFSTSRYFFIWDVFFVRTKCISNQTFPPSTVRSKMSFSIFDDWSPFTNCWFIGFPPQWYKRFLFNVHYRPVGCSEQCRHRGSVSRSQKNISTNLVGCKFDLLTFCLNFHFDREWN